MIEGRAEIQTARLGLDLLNYSDLSGLAFLWVPLRLGNGFEVPLGSTKGNAF